MEAPPAATFGPHPTHEQCMALRRREGPGGRSQDFVTPSVVLLRSHRFKTGPQFLRSQPSHVKVLPFADVTAKAPPTGALLTELTETAN